MILSDVSIRRPVVCLVASILIVLIGLLSFRRLPVREYPDIDSPIISVSTTYPGASAEVIESKITEPLEKEISSIDGIRVVRSLSLEQRSEITVEFNLRRDVNEAANDVRDRVSRARRQLPDEVLEPQVTKTEADADPIMGFSLASDRYSRQELYDIADRFVVQRIQTVPGVGAVQIRGPRYAMRLWIDSDRLAAHELTVADVERALQQQNVEIPGGRIESVTREFTVRTQGSLVEVAEFENLILAVRNGYQVKFSDIGRVELGQNDYRGESYYRGVPTVGVQVFRQSQSNLLDLADGVKAQLPLIQASLPKGVTIDIGFDSSVFVDRSVAEVYKTLWEAATLVILMIFVFLRDWRATFIPLLAIPVSVIGSFAIMSWLGFSLNVLTLLALVLAVGLVVDDAIVMLENIYRRIEGGEPPIRAAVHGARQVAFAIIATTLTLAAVFLPVAFQSGQTGRLFFEFGVTLAISVLVSAFVALTLTPMLSSRMLKARLVGGHVKHGWLYEKTEPFFEGMNRRYAAMLNWTLRHKFWVLLGAGAVAALGPIFYLQLQRELTPLEDRSAFRAYFIAPVGSTPEFGHYYAGKMEQMLLDVPEVERTFRRSGDSNRAFMFVTLKPWEQRERKAQQIIAEMREKFRREITGGQAFPLAPRPFGQRGGSAGIQVVLQGSDFDQLQQLGDRMIAAMRERTDMFYLPRVDPSPTKPQLDVRIDRAKAADLNVPISEIASTLETLFGGKRVTTFQRGSQEYDVLVQVADEDRTTPSDLSRVYVKSSTGHLIQLTNLVQANEAVVPENYPHFMRLRSVTVSAQLVGNATIGDGVDFLQVQAEKLLPAGYTYAWDGETREYVESASDTWMLFTLALVFTFLILAAQFESWIHPITIFTGIILALAGGVIVLYCTRFWGTAMTDNLYSRFGLIMLIGLVAKNGILIVEFANQLQLEGRNAFEAAYEASILRFRPIIMTAIATILGAVPIAFASGAGAETRNPMGIVVVGGLSIATFLTLFVVPIFYVLVDHFAVKVTGHSSAYGLKKAEEIRHETAEEVEVAAPAK
ncbi:efflux RND transporter permease subunit [Opitutus terrae]|uniref:Acriflavin resistance protein n=1 Tax=Opitutus terrae (strain DSM 11246 / JCM 15787 / PB90-1) TaxID=452637 RepID=B1ZU72_OPITP|nr:efflux RND transporter permease subunit [Opitutus terrae]ACB76638.1 acriflavin resistance protein [Opitutus terrae PB90-1]